MILLLISTIILRRRSNRAKPQRIRPRYRINQYIRIPEVQVIDDDSKVLGVMPTFKALALAQEQGLDLVEVNPTVRPSIVKIMDFGQFQYKQSKIVQAQKAKVKKIEVKGIRLSFKIGQHDKDMRLKQARKFLDEGHKVKLEMGLRGRERAHMDLARENMMKFVREIGDDAVVEVPLSKMGGRLNMQIGKSKSAVKTKTEEAE
ncbi:translation initiation factor IF-3 [Patescibacteria group bacterium]|nr:translation initiation factor IF-3 [Patescibacteria group bacterium]